jgi:Transposase IS66 family
VMRRELLAGDYIQADETPVDVQLHEGRGKNHQSYLWLYGRPEGSVVFDFRMGRGREGPKRFLGLFEGILQTDGYAAYEQVGGPKMVHAACWAHARRLFFEAVQLHPKDPIATAIVAHMDDLFAIDAEAHCRGLGSPRIFHDAILLNGGQVLLSGGEDDSNGSSTALSTAELYNPTTQLFTATAGNMTSVREHQTATLLNDGTVLEDGGTDGTNSFNTAEIYTASQLTGLTSIAISPGDAIGAAWKPTTSRGNGHFHWRQHGGFVLGPLEFFIYRYCYRQQRCQ